MKVLHLLSSNSFSGAENVVCQIIGMFKNDDCVEMIYVSPDGQIREALEERHVDFVPITKMSVKEVKRVIREERPDVVHAHDMRASVIAAFSCGKVRLISHIHNNAFASRKISVKSLAYLFAVRKAEHIFWVSDNSYKGYKFNKLCASKSSVLYNVIDLNELEKKMNGDEATYDNDVVFVGRLSYEKNPLRLIKVIKIAAGFYPKLKVAIVGAGDLEAETKRLAKEYHLENNIDFMGFKANPLKIMHDSKLMLMTSRWEGTPMCALEAMALGVPIVSTPTDGLRVLVEHGVSGFLADDDESLAKCVLSLVQNNSLRADMSAKALESAIRINDTAQYKAKIMGVLYRNAKTEA